MSNVIDFNAKRDERFAAKCRDDGRISIDEMFAISDAENADRQYLADWDEAIAENRARDAGQLRQA